LKGKIINRRRNKKERGMRKRMKRRRSRTENMQGKENRKHNKREEIMFRLFVVHLTKKPVTQIS
jgi:hypothetical protein